MNYSGNKKNIKTIKRKNKSVQSNQKIGSITESQTKRSKSSLGLRHL